MRQLAGQHHRQTHLLKVNGCFQVNCLHASFPNLGQLLQEARVKSILDGFCSAEKQTKSQKLFPFENGGTPNSPA